MYIQVAAHRGNQHDFPENTLPAFASAYRIGADNIELDLHMTADGEIIIIHDGIFSRTGMGDTHETHLTTLNDAQKIDVGRYKGEEFEGVHAPSLGEFLEQAKALDPEKKMTFNFEFKDYVSKLGEKFAFESADRIIRLVDEYGLWERSYVNSFDGRLLEYINCKYERRFRIHGFYPWAVCGKTSADFLSGGHLYCACVWNSKTPDGEWKRGEGPVNPKCDFDDVIAAGVQPWVGAGINKEEDVLSAVARGGVLFTNNDPVKLIAMLEKNGLRQK